jgi:xylulokinase
MVSESRTVDPSGTVAGFADATGRFLPLAATLNCTLAVDRVSGWLGLDREDAADHTDVVVLPYFDGERTPNLPHAAASIIGLRHATSPGEILLAAYQGAALGLLDALDMVDGHSSGIGADAPLILIGGGSKGPVWRRVVRSLSGRAVEIPEAEELVARGAAAQAAAVLHGDQAEHLARRWNTRRGTRLEPVLRDEEARDRITRAREKTAGLNS